MASITESERETQNRVIDLFRDPELLGYEYLGDWSDRSDNSNIEVGLLTENLKKRGYKDTHIHRAVDELRKAAICSSHRGLYDANKEVYSLLRYGAKVKDGRGGIKTVGFIDWDHFGDNDFAIAEEVSVSGAVNNKRPDLVVFVNGIALAVIELKRSGVSVAEGIRQNITNQRDEFIVGFFSTVQYIFAGNMSEGVRYGTVLTPEKYYLEWKNYVPARDEKYTDEVGADVLRVCAGMSDDKLKWQLYSMFRKERFLELIHDFVIFDDGKKKVCRHNQYFGVKQAEQCIKSGRGGIIWHTQGSGKTMTMVWLSKWILSNYHNARVLIITDREELDTKIERDYANVNVTIVRTTSGRDLVKRLNKFDDRLICSLIHKFGRHASGNADFDYGKYINDIRSSLPPDFEARGDFYVFVDECHRTQSGKLHSAMKAILPRAVFIGFTGTPLLVKDKKTSIEVFGGYIHTYKYSEGVADGVVLDLRYEARNIPQEVVAQDKIDAWFEAKTRPLTDKAKATLKRRWGNLQTVFSSMGRLDSIVNDVIFDMETKPRLSDGSGNALLVAGDIYSACRYYEIFQRKGLKQCAIITSYEPAPGNIRTEDIGGGEDTAEITKYDTYIKMLADNGYDVGRKDDFEKYVTQEFIKNPGRMRLLIVVDKLLTGFDAPPCTYLYIDKKMENHGLFQAICRVNRLDGESKEFGYIVDYMELFGALEAAMQTYTSGAFEGYAPEDVDGLLKNRLTEARKYLDATLESLDSLCEGIAVPRDEDNNVRRYFCGESSVGYTEEEIFGRLRERLYMLVNRVIRAFAEIKFDMDDAGYSACEQAEIGKKVALYTRMKEFVGRASGDALDLKIFEPGMRHLIDTYIDAGEAEPLGIVDDFTLLELIQVREKELESGGGDEAAAAEEIENNTRKKIVARMPFNPKYYAKMSEILEQLILERKRDVVAYIGLLQRYKELAKNVENPEENMGHYPRSIHNSGALRMFYDECYRVDETDESEKAEKVKKAEELALKLDEAVRANMQDGFRGNPIKRNKIKNALLEIIGDEEEVERLFELVIKQEEYR